jgi:hypothetical protein
MRRKFSIAIFCTLLIASLTFSFLLPSLLSLPRTDLNAQTLPTVTFFRATLPLTADHIADAQARGYPSVLSRTTDQRRIDRNRREACRGFVPQPPIRVSCDEYPFASTYEGGAGASIRGVPLLEQWIQGGILSTFYRINSVLDRGQFRVRVA